MLRKGGMKKIRAQFKGMLEKSNQLKMWADQFHHNVSSFYLNREDFDPQNLSTIFGQVYESKVSLYKFRKSYFFYIKIGSSQLYLYFLVWQKFWRAELNLWLCSDFKAALPSDNDNISHKCWSLWSNHQRKSNFRWNW